MIITLKHLMLEKMLDVSPRVDQFGTRRPIDIFSNKSVLIIGEPQSVEGTKKREIRSF